MLVTHVRLALALVLALALATTAPLGPVVRASGSASPIQEGGDETNSQLETHSESEGYPVTSVPGKSVLTGNDADAMRDVHDAQKRNQDAQAKLKRVNANPKATDDQKWKAVQEAKKANQDWEALEGGVMKRSSLQGDKPMIVKLPPDYFVKKRYPLKYVPEKTPVLTGDDRAVMRGFHDAQKRNQDAQANLERIETDSKATDDQKQKAEQEAKKANRDLKVLEKVMKRPSLQGDKPMIVDLPKDYFVRKH